MEAGLGLPVKQEQPFDVLGAKDPESLACVGELRTVEHQGQGLQRFPPKQRTDRSHDELRSVFLKELFEMKLIPGPLEILDASLTWLTMS